MIQVTLSRRTLLTVGAAIGGAVITATQWKNLSVFGGQDAPTIWIDGKKLVMLSAREAPLIELIGAAILPSSVVSQSGVSWPTVQQAQVVRRLDEELFFIKQQIVSDFRLALNVVNTLPLLYGHPNFFSSLPLSDQQACFRDSETTRFDSIRAAVNACRMVINMLYFSHESTWKAMHYDGSFAKLPQQLSAQRAYYKKLIEAQA